MLFLPSFFLFFFFFFFFYKIIIIIIIIIIIFVAFNSGALQPMAPAKYRWVLRWLDAFTMRPWLFAHLRKRGIQVVLWTLNTEEDYERAYRLGAGGVLTDYPSRLHAFLQARDEKAAPAAKAPVPVSDSEPPEIVPVAVVAGQPLRARLSSHV